MKTLNTINTNIQENNHCVKNVITILPNLLNYVVNCPTTNSLPSLDGCLSTFDATFLGCILPFINHLQIIKQKVTLFYIERKLNVIIYKRETNAKTKENIHGEILIKTHNSHISFHKFHILFLKLFPQYLFTKLLHNYNKEWVIQVFFSTNITRMSQAKKVPHHLYTHGFFSSFINFLTLFFKIN